MMPDTRSSPEAGGFQSLFASASQDLPGADVNQNVRFSLKRGSGPDGLSSAGNKSKPKASSSADSDSVLHALAAALAMPVSAPSPCPPPASDNVGAEDASSVVTIGSDAPAGGAPIPNLNADACTIGTGTTAASGVQDFTSAVDILNANGSGADTDAMTPAVGDGLQPQRGSGANTVDPLSASAAQNISHEAHAGTTATSPRRHGSSDSQTELGKGTPVMAEGGEPVTSAAAALPPVAQASDTIRVEGVTVIDSASPSASITSPAAGQNTDTRIAKPAASTSAAGAAGAAVARPSDTTLGVEPAGADRSPRERRGSSSDDPSEQSGPDEDGFPGIAQSTASAPVVAQTGQAAGAPMPHSNPGSPAPSEHTSTLGPAHEAAALPPPPTLQTTQVLQRMDTAEIRIGLQSTDFGAIRLHTSVSSDQVGAVVSTSHPGLRDALLVEALSLEKAMARHSLRLDSVSVGGGSANSNFNSFGNNEHQQPRAGPSGVIAWPAGRPQPAQSAGAAPIVPEGRRLDVRA